MTETLKRALRREYLSLRNALPADERNEKSAAIAEFFLSSGEYKKCGALFIYMNMGSEAATSGIIKKALGDGKPVALPFILNKSDREMVFIKISSVENLITNDFGVAEPVYDDKKILQCGPDTLIAAPGVAFSADGSRVGYGGGYYDRYLMRNKYLCAAGLCFTAQLSAYIPADSSDVKMDMLVTEKGIDRRKN